MRPLLLAAGYLNIDVTATVPRVPALGDRVTALSVSRSFGGMTANAACAASRFGLKTEFFGTVGGDPEGDAALSELERYGVETRWVVRSVAPTTTAILLLGPDGERSIISEPMRFDYGPLEEALKAYSNRANACVHVDGYRLPEAVGLLQGARALGLRTSADLDGMEEQQLKESLPEVAASLDLLILNSRLVAALDPDPALAAGRLRGLGAGVVAITLGERGAMVAWKGGASLLRAPKVEVRDATGAGDAFAGAFLAGWLGGYGPEEAAKSAVAAGAISVGARGARGHLPDRVEAGRLADKVEAERQRIDERRVAG